MVIYVFYRCDFIFEITSVFLLDLYTVLPRYNANIGTLPFLGIMAGWHYGEGGDLGLWIYAS